MVIDVSLNDQIIVNLTLNNGWLKGAESPGAVCPTGIALWEALCGAAMVF